jgi:hypothetical protein
MSWLIAFIAYSLLVTLLLAFNYGAHINDGESEDGR